MDSGNRRQFSENSSNGFSPSFGLGSGPGPTGQGSQSGEHTHFPYGQPPHPHGYTPAVPSNSVSTFSDYELHGGSYTHLPLEFQVAGYPYQQPRANGSTPQRSESTWDMKTPATPKTERSFESPESTADLAHFLKHAPPPRSHSRNETLKPKNKSSVTNLFARKKESEKAKPKVSNPSPPATQQAVPRISKGGKKYMEIVTSPREELPSLPIFEKTFPPRRVLEPFSPLPAIAGVGSPNLGTSEFGSPPERVRATGDSSSREERVKARKIRDLERSKRNTSGEEQFPQRSESDASITTTTIEQAMDTVRYSTLSTNGKEDELIDTNGRPFDPKPAPLTITKNQPQHPHHEEGTALSSLTARLILSGVRSSDPLPGCVPDPHVKCRSVIASFNKHVLKKEERIQILESQISGLEAKNRWLEQALRKMVEEQHLPPTPKGATVGVLNSGGKKKDGKLGGLKGFLRLDGVIEEPEEESKQ